MDIIKIIEIFAFLSGLVYIVLEVRQKNLMWVVGILTGVACAYSFAVQHLYATMGLNIYNTIISIWGLWQWSKDSKAGESKGELHLRHISTGVVLASLAVVVFGTFALSYLLSFIGETSTLLDSSVTLMSAVATFWLAKSYPVHWLLWIVADILAAALCLTNGMYWMTVLYLAYSAASVIGYRHWMKNGKFIN